MNDRAEIVKIEEHSNSAGDLLPHGQELFLSLIHISKMIGVGLQSFCIDGSVAEDRKVGLGHGNLGAMLPVSYTHLDVYKRQA